MEIKEVLCFAWDDTSAPRLPTFIALVRFEGSLRTDSVRFDGTDDQGLLPQLKECMDSVFWNRVSEEEFIEMREMLRRAHHAEG